MNKNNIYLLQNNSNQSFRIILNKRLLVFKTQGLYCRELIFCKWVNCEKPDIRMKVRMKN